MQSYLNRRDITQKRQIIIDIFGEKLPGASLAKVMHTCDEAFASHDEITAAALCQLFSESCPEIDIDKETRLRLLRQFRQYHTEATSEPMSCHPSVAMSNSASTIQEYAFQDEQLLAFERRRERRKLTHLTGRYWHLMDERLSGEMVVENLSLSGCRLQILDDHSFVRNDPLRLQFNLDDASETLIDIPGSIRWSLYTSVGVVFQNPCRLPQTLADYIAS